MPLPVLVVSSPPTRCIRFVNEAGEAFFGASKKRMLGTSLASLFPNTPRLLALLDKTASSAMSVSDHALHIDMASGKRLVTLHITPLHVPDPKPDDGHNHKYSHKQSHTHSHKQGEDMLLMIQENALGERLRAQAPQQEAGRRLSVVTAMLAHEIKTPLAAIRGATELLAAGSKPTLTKLIISETDRITGLINRMESLGAGAPPRLHPINIHEVIDHALAIAVRSFAKHHTLHRQFDPSLPETMGDRDLLIQALVNLIKNACEASDEKKAITIATLYNTGPRLNQVRQSPAAQSMPKPVPKPSPKPMLSVAVKNYGSGIDPDLGDRIFDVFTTTKANGSGLGLALVARVATAHEGAVEVVRETDAEGASMTAFYFSIPITKTKVTRETP